MPAVRKTSAVAFGIISPLVVFAFCSAAAHGRPITFGTFARFVAPLTACQIVLSGLYVSALRWIVTR